MLRHRPSLLRYCRRLALADARAEDVVQQALLRAWSALRRGAEVRDLRAWLFRIVHNTAVNFVRESSREDLQLMAESDAALGTGSRRSAADESTLERGLSAREALGSIAALPLMQREVIFRTAVAGYSHEEVASALGLSEGAVRGLLYRARVALRTTVTAITPPPLINWLAGAGQGASAERVGELAAGGGSVGLGGLLLKGGLAAITAGTLLTGAAIVHSHAPARHHGSGAAPSRTGRELASLGGSRGHVQSLPGGSGPAAGGAQASLISPSAAPGRHRHASNKTTGARRSGPSTSRPNTVGYGQHSSGEVPQVSGSGPGGSGTGSPNGGFSGAGQGPSAGGPGGGGSGSGDGSGDGSGGGSGSGSGAQGGGGSAGGGTGSGGAGGSGGSSGGSGAGGSPVLPPTGGGGSGGAGSEGGSSGGSGSGGGSGGGSSGGSGSGGGSAGGGAGGGSGGSSDTGGPVTTVVHEATGLLESTVNGVLHVASPPTK